MLTDIQNMHFFPILPLQTLALEKSRILRGQVPSHAILISSFSEPPIAVGGSKLQASHHILYVTQLYWAREGLPGADCDTVISERAMPSHLTSSCVISSQGARVPQGISILISPWIMWVGGGTGSLKACQQEMHVVHGPSKEPLCTTGWKQTQKALLELPSKPCS